MRLFLPRAFRRPLLRLALALLGFVLAGAGAGVRREVAAGLYPDGAALASVASEVQYLGFGLMGAALVLGRRRPADRASRAPGPLP